MAIKQDVNAPLILTIGIVSGLLLLVIVFGLEAWFVREENVEITTKFDNSTNPWLVDRRAEQRAKIAGIEEAKQLVIRNNGKLPATRPVK